MKPRDIVADGHLKWKGGYRIDTPVSHAIASGWHVTSEFYVIDRDDRQLRYFLGDLLAGARGPFAELLMAIADAQHDAWTMYEERCLVDERMMHDWWRITDCAEPVRAVIERCLAVMHDTTDFDSLTREVQE